MGGVFPVQAQAQAAPLNRPAGQTGGHGLLERAGPLPGVKSATITTFLRASVKTADLASQNPIRQIYFHSQKYVPAGFHLVLKGEREEVQVVNAARADLLY